jgi:hypothetical protein
MAVKYTIVQYVPDPVKDERVNIGVIAFEDGTVRSRFLRTWARVQTFGGESVEFLKDFARRVSGWSDTTLPLPGFETEVRLEEEGIARIAGRWMNSIQFTEPRASMLSPDEVIDEVAPRFLNERVVRRGFRDRRVAASLARTSVREALRETLGNDWQKVYKTNAVLKGSLDEHQFDVAATNGKPFFAAHGISFEVPPSRELRKEIDATAWAVDDVRKEHPNLPLALVALPPRTQSKLFASAQRVFNGLRVDVLVGGEVSEWASVRASLVEP